MAIFFCKANSRTAGYSVVSFESHSIVLGIRPEFRKNGANPVLSERAELIANSMAGSFATQSF